MELATSNQDFNSGDAGDDWDEKENINNDVDDSYEDLENEILKQMNFSQS